MARAPLFELHIRPMFRLMDRIHMRRMGPDKRVDLWDYDEVRSKAGDIESWLAASSPMPPIGSGGPWPQEWIDLFRRWRALGCPRLHLAEGSNYALTEASGGRLLLSCKATLPEAGAAVWFEAVAASPDAQRYILALQRGPGPPAPGVLDVEERISGPFSIATVIVEDKSGEHALAIP